MYTFGTASLSKLNTCHKDLQEVLKLAISKSKIDFGVSEGHRTLERQLQLYNEGKSKVDGKRVKGKHNFNPSLAVDIYIYHPDLPTRQKLAYDRMHLAYVAGVIDACAEKLFKEGKITHKIRWGANWDSDGIIDYDQSFDDFPHFELIN